MSCTLCKLSCNNCFALRVWSAKETKSTSYFFFVPFRWHYQFYSFQIIKEYKSGAVTRACALRWHLLKQFFFTYELGWLNEGSLPFAPAISRCHWQQFHRHLHQLEQKKNKKSNFSRLLNNMKTLQFCFLACSLKIDTPECFIVISLPPPPPPPKKVSTLITVKGGYLKLSPDR